MEFSDSYFPEDSMQRVNGMVGSELRRQEMEARVLAFIDTYTSDPQRADFTVQKNTSLYRVWSDGGTLRLDKHDGETVFLPPMYNCEMSRSSAYNHHPHPHAPGEIALASVVLYADPTPADDNRSYHVIAMLARRAGADEQTQLLEEEVNNCVPLLVMPEGIFGFDVFAATEEPGVFSQLDASQAEGVLTTEMQRYVDAVNIQNNPPPPAAT